jgi:transcriptional regulator with XRE-family HTH domain
MIGIRIKELREKKGLTIEELAADAGISSKTIQRLENGKTKGRGYTLKQIATALEIDIELLTSLSASGNPAQQKEDFALRLLKKLNLSALLILFLPLSNLLFPLYYYSQYKHYALVKAVGGKIISFQILWLIITSISLIVAPFMLLLFDQPIVTPLGSLIFSYLFFWLINMVITIKTAISINNKSGEALGNWPNML